MIALIFSVCITLMKSIYYIQNSICVHFYSWTFTFFSNMVLQYWNHILGHPLNAIDSASTVNAFKFGITSGWVLTFHACRVMEAFWINHLRMKKQKCNNDNFPPCTFRCMGIKKCISSNQPCSYLFILTWQWK